MEGTQASKGSAGLAILVSWTECIATTRQYDTVSVKCMWYGRKAVESQHLAPGNVLAMCAFSL